MRKRTGFTLAELLIVIAIIAVLIGIALPVLSNRLAEAKKTVDESNLYSAYEECMVKMINTNKDIEKYVELTSLPNYKDPWLRVQGHLTDESKARCKLNNDNEYCINPFAENHETKFIKVTVFFDSEMLNSGDCFVSYEPIVSK